MEFVSGVFQVIFISAFFVVLQGQIVTVNMQNQSSDPKTATATLRCDFEIDDTTFSFFNLEWRFGTTLVADFFNRATDPDYYDFCQTPGRCSATRTNSMSELVLSSLEWPRDQGTYKCTVTFDLGALRSTGQDSSLLTITVEGNPGNSQFSFGGKNASGSVVELNRDVPEHIFTAEVKKVNPGMDFNWTLDGKPLPKKLVSETVNVVDSDGLTTSSSNATLEPNADYDGQLLKFKAFNYEGDPGIEMSVQLRVEEATTTEIGVTSTEPPGLGGTDPDATTTVTTGPGGDGTTKVPGVTPTPQPPGCNTVCIIGIAVGAVVVAVLIVGAVIYFCTRQKQRQ